MQTHAPERRLEVGARERAFALMTHLSVAYRNAWQHENMLRLALADTEFGSWYTDGGEYGFTIAADGCAVPSEDSIGFLQQARDSIGLLCFYWRTARRRALATSRTSPRCPVRGGTHIRGRAVRCSSPSARRASVASSLASARRMRQELAPARNRLRPPSFLLRLPASARHPSPSSQQTSLPPSTRARTSVSTRRIAVSATTSSGSREKPTLLLRRGALCAINARTLREPWPCR